MSRIVFLELKRQYEKEIEAKNRELSKTIKDSKRLKIETEIELLDVNKQLEKFNNFYKRISAIDNFNIIEYKNEYLEDIVDRAINRKKPFTEEKTELKDALIWKTYADFVETNKLEDCILLTNNTSDFCDKKDKSKVHTELLKDSEKFTVINSSFDFIKTKSKILESPEHKFQAYMKNLDFDNGLVLELIQQNFEKEIENRIHRKIEDLSPNDLFKPEDHWYDGYVSGFSVEILECSDSDYEILDDRALVSGIISISCETEAFQYNSARDKGEDTFISLGEHTLIFDVNFNFDMAENEIATEFEITDVDIIEIT
jgi:hypothetical protein